MDTDEAPSAAAPSSATESDVNMPDAKSAADAPGSENDAQGDLPAQMETDAKVRINCVSTYAVKFSISSIVPGKGSQYLHLA